MQSCFRKDLVWKSRLAGGLCVLLILGLAASGRLWPGPKYPVGMVLIVLQSTVVTGGYALALKILSDAKQLSALGDVSRAAPFITWLAIVISIVGRFRWGWYLVLGVLLWGFYKSWVGDTTAAEKWDRSHKVWMVIEVVFIVYVLLNKPFFSQW